MEKYDQWLFWLYFSMCAPANKLSPLKQPGQINERKKILQLVSGSGHSSAKSIHHNK
jgi:hypothetical protein